MISVVEDDHRRRARHAVDGDGVVALANPCRSHDVAPARRADANRHWHAERLRHHVSHPGAVRLERVTLGLLDDHAHAPRLRIV